MVPKRNLYADAAERAAARAGTDRRTMDLRQLRYFAQVVESGSFSKAANQLHVAQPALSQHVRHLEEELGVVLLHRSSQGVKTTEAGDRLMGHAKRILADFAGITDSVRGKSVAPRGVVRFGMPGTVGELLAVPLIEAAKARYPDIRIRVVEAMSGYILDWLKRGDLDLAMIYATSDPRGLVVHHGLSEEICLFACRKLAAANPLAGPTVALEVAAQLPLIVPGLGHGLRELIETVAADQGVDIVPAIEIDSYAQIKRLALRGLGFGILPMMAVGEETRTGDFQVWRFTPPGITRKVYLAYSAERPLQTASRAVGQLSWEILRQQVRSGVWVAELADDRHAPKLYD
jgi:LysR family nitrogen assimilation transcriptional regulator